MKTELSNIVLDESIYPRNSVSDFSVNKMVQAYEAGAKFPPMIVEASTMRLVDGWHRYRMYEKAGIAQVNVTEKVYATEADLFADSVRFNVAHGLPLDQYSIDNAIIRLEAYGYKREQISEVIRVPVDRIEKIVRGFAKTPAGEPLAVKGGLSHLHAAVLTDAQQATNRHYSGGKATFHLKQLCELLENDMWPRTANFVREMDRLIELWSAVSEEKKSA